MGYPWRNRPHVHLNSASTVSGDNEPPLPLLGGPTTRVIGTNQPFGLQVNLLLDRPENKRVACDNGETKQYIDGFGFGALAAWNIAFFTDDYIVDQQVDESATQKNSDGSIRLTMVDEDSKRRQLDASTAFFATGPGPEQTKVPSLASQQLYEDTAEQLRVSLRRARVRIAEYRDALRALEETQPQLQSIAAIRGQVKSTIAQIAQSVKVPRLLTPTTFEDLFGFWLVDLEGEPELYPFTDIFTQSEDVSIGIVGPGDSGRVMNELVAGQSSETAYPAGFRPQASKATIYGEQAQSPEEYAAGNRKRYAGVYTERTSAVGAKVDEYRLRRSLTGEDRGMQVFYTNGSKRKRNLHPYIVDATGLDESPITDKFPDDFFQDVRDIEGVVVGRGSDNLYVVGSATGFRASDFPLRVQNIFDALGVPENTKALWVYGILCERLAYTYLLSRQPKPKKRPSLAFLAGLLPRILLVGLGVIAFVVGAFLEILVQENFGGDVALAVLVVGAVAVGGILAAVALRGLIDRIRRR